jgi:hypothetical protein
MQLNARIVRYNEKFKIEALKDKYTDILSDQAKLASLKSKNYLN